MRGAVGDAVFRARRQHEIDREGSGGGWRRKSMILFLGCPTTAWVVEIAPGQVAWNAVAPERRLIPSQISVRFPPPQFVLLRKD
ncbi:hypothetical protein U1Q18_022455 [Sarracenia purpurea var. burkii]